MKRQIVEVEAGSTWERVLESTLPHRLAPCVLTSEHATTVGGTLSVGGIGSTSFRYGAQVHNVAYLDVATASGELLRCSPSSNSFLFSAVRAGLGQFGVIVRAGVLLRPVKQRIRTFTFVYDSSESFLLDLRTLARSAHDIHLLAHFTPISGTERQRIRLTAGVEFSSKDEPQANQLGANRYNEILPSTDANLFGENHIFYFRYADWFTVSSQFVYPWVDHYFSWDRAGAYLDAVLKGRFGPLLKMGVSTIIPLAARFSDSPLLTRKEPQDALLLIGLFPQLPVALADLAELVTTYSNTIETEFDATRYLYGYLDFATADWRHHFRDVWPQMQEMKRRFDPAGILGANLFTH